MKHCWLTLCVLLCGSSIWAPSGHAQTNDRKGLDFFEAKIRPVLVESCYQCHSANAASQGKLKGGLQVDTRAGLIKGGDSGTSIVPGKPGESLLIAALKHESVEMPPKGKLPESIIGHFVKWIEMGAPDPREGEVVTIEGVDIDAGRQHWAFQPLHEIVPPTVQDTLWGQTPIDQFIRARQAAVGITPNPTAAAQTLIRRVYFDLTGLPPTADELLTWQARLTPAPSDETANPEADAGTSIDAKAYAELVDHLLNSQHYGERWGRHWLDLARFAESNGYAFDQDRANAYQYRDFVIRALNADMPYDEFVRLQVAGDVLANPNPQTPDDAARARDAIAATGFLTAGPFTTQQTQKERERSRYEQLDDIIQTLSTSMLGLTVGCCRCHDHKYDPLPQNDYYRLVSCFSEVGFADVGVNMQPEEYRELHAKFAAEHAPLVAARTDFEQLQLPARFDSWFSSRPSELPAPVLGVWNHIGPFPADSFDQAFDRAFEPESDLDLTKTYAEGTLKWTEQPSWEDGKVHNTFTGTNAANYIFRVIESPVARKVGLSLGSDDALKVWVNGTELLANKIGRGAAPDQEKLELPLKKGRNELLMKIVNGSGPSGFYFKSTLDATPPEVLALLEKPQTEWTAEERQTLVDWYKTIDEEWLKLNAAVVEHQKQEPQPNLTQIYSAKVRGTTYGFGDDTYKVYFLGRGNVENKRGVAPAGFLQVLMDSESTPDHWLKPTPSAEESNRAARIGLADWLTDTNQGAGNLLARVIVNRLWQHHLGRGIVATPSDFGTRGDAPSHPQLLDWLAAQLIRENWKLKPIHRLIVTSSVYMQGTDIAEAGKNLDPDNMLLWRREPRRLEAEVIRDSLLAVSGTLDPTMYGAGSLDEKMPRRSVYLTVKRSQLIPLLQLFDAPDAMQGIGAREESTVAPQALAMINSPLVREWATMFAQRVRPSAESTLDAAALDAALDRAYLTALSRKPTDDEKSTMTEFIAQQTAARGNDPNAQTLAFRDVCHLLLCMNEFVYVD